MTWNRVEYNRMEYIGKQHKGKQKTFVTVIVIIIVTMTTLGTRLSSASLTANPNCGTFCSATPSNLRPSV